MPNTPDLTDLFDKPNPRTRVHSIASKAGITPDLADDYYKLTNVESGHNVNVRDSSKGAQGFGQVMPDVKGGTTRTVGGKRYNLRNPDENIEAGLRYFAEGGSDPVARRLHYFGGPRARQRYERTGQIPNISDGNMTASQYVKATGAYQKPQAQSATPDLSDLFDKPSGQTQPATSQQNRVNLPPTPATTPVESRQPSVPKQPLRYSGSGRAFDFQRPASTPEPAPKPLYSGSGRAFDKLQAGGKVGETPRAFSARQPSTLEKIKEAVGPYVPGLTTLDTPFGVKTDPIRGAVSGATLGAVGDPRQVSAEERIVDPEAQSKADLAHQVGSFAPALIPYVAAERALTAVPLLAQSTRAANIARTALTFGGVELGREAIRAAKTDTPLDPKEVAISTAIGAAMGTLSGVNPSLKRRLVAFITPQAVTDAARGTDPQHAVLNALTNLGFGLAGGRAPRDLEVRLRDAERASETRPATTPEVEASQSQPAQSEIQPRNAEVARGVGDGVPTNEGVETPRKWAHTDFGEVTESPNQRRLGKGRVRVTDSDGRDHVIKRADLSGRGNQKAIPLKETPAQEVPEVSFDNVPFTESQKRELEATLNLDAGLEAAGEVPQPTKVPEIDIHGAPEVAKPITERPTETAPTEVAPIEPSTEAVLARSLNSTGSGINAVVDALKKSKYKAAFLKELGGGAEAIENPAGEALFRTANGDIVKLRSAYKEDATYGDRTGGFIVERFKGEDAKPILERAGVEYQPSPMSPDTASLLREELGRVQTEAPKAFRRFAAGIEEAPTPGTRAAGRQRVLSRLDEIDAQDASRPPIEPIVAKPETPVTETPITPETPRAATESREPSTTAVKNASMAADRAAMDLPELAQAEPRKAAEVRQRAIDANTKDPRSVDRLTEQALATDKPFTDVETAQVRLRAQEIKNRESELLREINETNDPQEIASKRAELDSLTNEFDRLSQATKKAGTEWGRAGVARQQAIDQDFSLVAMKARVKAAKGEQLSPKETAKIEDLHKRLTAAEAERDAANERASQAELQKQINRSTRKRTRQESIGTLDDEFAALRAQFTQARAETSRVQASGLAALDPEGKLTVLIGKMARNRVKAGVTEAAQLVDDIHAAIADSVEGVTKRDIRDAISGYGLQGKGDKRGEAAKQLAGIRTELRRLSRSEDIASESIPNPRDVTRRKQLLKQEADLQQRMAAEDFSKPSREAPKYTRETYATERRVKELKTEFERLRYHATRSTAGKILDTAVGVGNIPKTMLSMGDLSAVLRQGGIGYVQHPILSTRAAKDMLKSFTQHGFANVENAIKNAKDKDGRSLYELATKSGLEFTGVDRDAPQLNRREEGYLGSGALDTLSQGKYNPLKYTVKPIKDFSERTFVSFLDSQRMRIFEQQAQALRDMGLTGKEFDAAIKSQAQYINKITGRGSLGTEGNKLAPALNLAMFSPRLVASRFQYLANPLTYAAKPKGARKLQMIDDAKFLVGAASVLGLAKAAGAQINLDPDDADFLKMKVGNTRLDTLAGLQQPMRFMIRMAKAVKGGETYSGDPKGKILADFARSKASPEVGLGWDYFEGSNRLSGKKFDAKTDTAKALIPLPIQDFREAIKEDGALKGSVEALPSIFGVGTQTYKGAAEKPTTHAEKLARRFIMRKLPDEARDQEQIDTDTKKSELRARSRKGEDVSADIQAMGARLTERQVKGILDARNKTRLQEDVNRLGPREAIIVYSVATPAQKTEIKDLLQSKSALIDAMAPDLQEDVRKRYEAAGFTKGELPRKQREQREERRPRPTTRTGYLSPP